MFVTCEKLLLLCGKHVHNEDAEDREIAQSLTKYYLSNFSYESIMEVISKGQGVSRENSVEDREEQRTSYLRVVPRNDFPIEEEKYNSVMDSLEDSGAPPDSADARLDEEILTKRRPSFGMLPFRKNSVQRLTPASVLVQCLISQPNVNPDFSYRVIEYQVRILELIRLTNYLALLCTQKDLNNKPTGWETLFEENDIELLCALLLEWFETLDVRDTTDSPHPHHQFALMDSNCGTKLQVPIIDGRLTSVIKEFPDDCLKCLFQFDRVRFRCFFSKSSFSNSVSRRHDSRWSI